jgi:protein-tyrosine phosphatase
MPVETGRAGLLLVLRLPPAGAAMRRRIDLSGLRARQVTLRDFMRFDLILAMDHDNLRDLRGLRPANSRAQLKLFLEYAQGFDDLDMPDPYYGDAGAFERVLDLATLASRGLIAALAKPSLQQGS